jgi:hypothetical protein
VVTDPEVRLRFPTIPDFLRSGGSGKGSAQPREYNSGATWKMQRLRSRKPRIRPVLIRHADHVAPSIRKSWH